MPSTIRKFIISAPFILPALGILIMVLVLPWRLWEQLLVLFMFNLILLYPAYGLHSSSFAPRFIATFFHRCLVILVVPFALLMIVYSRDTGKHVGHTILLFFYSVICLYSYILHKDEEIPVVEITEKKYSHMSRNSIERWRNQAPNAGKLKFFRVPHKMGIWTILGVISGSLMIVSLGIGGVYIALFLTQNDFILMLIILLFGLAMLAWGLYAPFDLYKTSRYCIVFFEKGVLEKTWLGFCYYCYQEVADINYHKQDIPDIPGTRIDLYIKAKERNHTMHFHTHWSPMEWDSELDTQVDNIKSQINS